MIRILGTAQYLGKPPLFEIRRMDEEEEEEANNNSNSLKFSPSIQKDCIANNQEEKSGKELDDEDYSLKSKKLSNVRHAGERRFPLYVYTLKVDHLKSYTLFFGFNLKTFCFLLCRSRKLIYYK